jgi:uncharacterized protein (TIGR02611 family)
MTRLARIGAGLVLVLLGLFLLVLPGPGILTIAAGLSVLAVDFAWAANLLGWMKRKYRSYFTRGGDVPIPEDPDYEGG